MAGRATVLPAINRMGPVFRPPVSLRCGHDWVTGNEERLIKIVLNGLMGPIEVLDKEYPGQVPMTPFGGMLNDEEMARY